MPRRKRVVGSGVTVTLAEVVISMGGFRKVIRPSLKSKRSEEIPNEKSPAIEVVKLKVARRILLPLIPGKAEPATSVLGNKEESSENDGATTAPLKAKLDGVTTSKPKAISSSGRVTASIHSVKYPDIQANKDDFSAKRQ